MKAYGSFNVKWVQVLCRVACVLAVMAFTPVPAHGAASCAIGSSCITPWGATVLDGASTTAYQSSSVACGSSCVGQTRSCSNGTLSGNYTYQSCTSSACACTLPWGGSLASGSSVTAYQYSSVPYGNSCTNQSRTCNNGTLSGSYTYQSCTVQAAAGCSLPWGGSISSGQSATAYNTSASCGGCASQSRTCTNGSLSGSYGYGSCNNASCASCTLPWGGSIAHGASVTAYAAASVPYGSSCSGQTRTCNNGTLSGSYANKTCSVAAPASCSLPWGGTLAHGSSVTAYAAASVACGGSCSGQTRTCNNGSLSGSYTNKTCSVSGCTCSYNIGTPSWGAMCENEMGSGTIANGATKTFSYADCGYIGNATFTCSNGYWDLTSGGSCTFCFLPDVPITLADGTTKPMNQLKVGDMVLGKTRYNRVEEVPNFDVDTPIYGFNGGKAFVTGGHPFWTKDGWKAVDPALTPVEHHNVHTTKLNVGDELFLVSGKKLKITSIRAGGVTSTHHVFDPVVSGDHTYYANGFLVHNKPACK